MGENGKITLRFRLNGVPQLHSAENIGILGSSKEFNSWKKILHMSWNDKKGWVAQVDLETKGLEGELKFKFVIVDGKDKNNVLVWEEGDDRKFTLPQDGGFYQMVCHWNNTREPVNLWTLDLDGKVTLSFLLNGVHQVRSGEIIGILGSSEEFNSWKKILQMSWTENGWVGQIEIETKERQGELIEFKFVIADAKDKNNVVVWEGRDNRKFTLPRDGFFQMGCHWNNTGEPVNLSKLVAKEKTWFAAMETVTNNMKEAELEEEKEELYIKEAPPGDLNTLERVEDLGQMSQLAREANDRVLKMVSFAQKLLAEQEFIMETVVQESERLKLDADENSKLRDSLMDHESVVEELKGEIAVICKDMKFLKEKFDECIPFSKSVSEGLMVDWFPEHDLSSGTGTLTKIIPEPSVSSVREDRPIMNKDAKFDGKKSLSDDDWDII